MNLIMYLIKITINTTKQIEFRQLWLIFCRSPEVDALLTRAGVARVRAGGLLPLAAKKQKGHNGLQNRRARRDRRGIPQKGRV